MSEFKVVIKSSYLGSYWYKRNIGETFTVIQSPSNDDCWQTVDEGRGILKDDCELAWQPKQGEMIEVREKPGKVWVPREYRGQVDGFYVCVNIMSTDDRCLWPHARPIKTTVTIIKESTGEKVEISQESSTSIFG